MTDNKKLMQFVTGSVSVLLLTVLDDSSVLSESAHRPVMASDLSPAPAVTTLPPDTKRSYQPGGYKSAAKHRIPKREQGQVPNRHGNGKLVSEPTDRVVSDPKTEASVSDRRPNIVFCMADDWSWPHAGVLGDPVVKTPNFDRVAQDGLLFENAFVSTPSCTPSRLSILTGQHHWRLGEGDSLGGSLREDFAVYTELLERAGYRVGRFGKGVWPSKHKYRNRDSFGERFRSFDEFLSQRKSGEPFCYWHGGQDPHRPYELGVGKASGMDLSKIRVPGCLPDSPTVRSDLADYLWEVQRFDSEVGRILSKLESTNELDNTIVVVSGDNGMPFPRCKATLYDQGTRVPLAIRWNSSQTSSPGRERQGDPASPRRTKAFVNLCDLAPTFLEAAGIEVPSAMTGRSLLRLLESDGSDESTDERAFVITGREKHVYDWPARAIRTRDFLYVRNFLPTKWRSGDVTGKNPEYDFGKNPWPTEKGAFSFNIDPSPTKQFLRLNRDSKAIGPLARLSLKLPPEEELYDLVRDPEQLSNVAKDPDYASSRQFLRRQLDAELIKSLDPRLAVPGYQTQAILGWPVRVSDRLMQEQEANTKLALELLRKQLAKVVQRVPPNALAHIRHVPIWLSPEYPGVRPTAEYHPGAGWLRKVGRRPELERCVELTNVSIFAKECRRMPMMLLHELAHAFHHQVLAFEEARVVAVYDAAVAGGSYEAVQRHDGKTVRAYAINNAKEYFAESSEAFFGKNDFFPFNREQLKDHDPAMFHLLNKLWATED